MRKKCTGFFVMLAVYLTVVSCGLASTYSPGTYEGQGFGFGGPVTVEIVTDEEGITDVIVKGEQETEAIGGMAIPELTQQIKDAQSADIDGVTGATLTSNAVKEAAGKAIEAAKGETQTATVLKPGTYTATVESYQHEHVTVSVTVDENRILDVEIVELTDFPSTVTEVPRAEIPAAIVENQSYNVDAVTGATFTSNSIKAAVRDCLEQAGGSDAFSAPVEKAEPVAGTDVETDILVVGGGGAGLVATAEAYRDRATGKDGGLRVMLIEKAAFLGGTTGVSGGMFYYYENETGVADEAWRKHVMESEIAVYGSNIQEPFNQDLLYSETGVMPDAWELFEYCGMEMEPRWGDMGIAPKPGDEEKKWEGNYMIKGFRRYLEGTDVDIRLNTAAKALVTDDQGAVIGVKVQDKTSVYTIYAKKVILATGGFPDNPEMIAKYAPDWVGIPPFACGTNTGDGLEMALAVGAGKIGDSMMAYIGPDNIMGIREDYGMTFGTGTGVFMCVNKDAKRFCDETMDRNRMAYLLKLQESDPCWGIVDGNNKDVEAVETTKSNYVLKADTLEELAGLTGLPAEQLLETVMTYNGYVDAGKDEEFGTLPEGMDRVDTAPYYAFPIRPYVMSSFVAPTVDGNCHVLNEQGEIIENLYAAGDLVEGNKVKLHVGSRAVATAIYTGVLAAQSAKAEISAE